MKKLKGNKKMLHKSDFETLESAESYTFTICKLFSTTLQNDYILSRRLDQLKKIIVEFKKQ